VAAVAEKTGGKPIEIWFADEARIGQKNKITRRWAKRGTRPSAPRDQRTASAYIFGAICPQDGKGAALVLPSCNTEAMALHLKEIAATVAPGGHAILVLDQAGWHVSKALPVPTQHYARAGDLAPSRKREALNAKPPACGRDFTIAAEIARTQPGRKYLAVHEGQLAIEPRLHLLHKHRRPLLLCLEQTRRPAMANHVHRNSPAGKPVMLMKTWYNSALFAPLERSQSRKN
jgi:DDE superfamily endonuclease